MASPDLMAQQIVVEPAATSDGLVSDSGHAAFTNGPDVIDDIHALEFGTPIMVG